MELRFTFNTVAALYDRARPGYPDGLFADATAHLAKGERILEVGSGTGKATASFARLGFPILALEPGGNMIAAAKEALTGRDNVQFIETTFENWTVEPGAFGLVTAAQAWHWVDPRVGFAKAFEALRPDGRLAVFGNAPAGMPGTLREDIAGIYEKYLPGYQSVVHEAAYRQGGPFGAMIEASDLFGPVTYKCYPWKWPRTAESYTDHLRSTSHHRVMDERMRETILSEVAAVIEAHGGQFEEDYEAHLYMATRKD